MNFIWDSENILTYKNKIGYYKFKTEFNYIMKNIIGKNILDLGGGSGRMAIPLSNLGYELTVIEQNKDALSILKSRNNNITVYNEDILKFRWTQIYDSIISIEVLQYFSKDELYNIFTNANDLLKVNGVFIFTYVNNKSWRFQIRSLYKKITKNRFDYSYERIDSLNDIITKNNFEIIDIMGYNWIPLKINSNNILVDLFVRIEETFKLKFWLKQSPWLLYTIKKNN